MLERSLPLASTILYSLKEPVDYSTLAAVLRVAGEWAGLGDSSVDAAADALGRRWREATPWETLVPQPGRDASLAEVHATAPYLANVARMRGYSMFRTGGLRCCLDWLNPQNELMMPSNCIAEPTLALLFDEEDTIEARGSVRSRLAANDGWWNLVHRVATLLPVARVMGVHSVGFLLDFGRSQVDPRYSPGDFLFPVHLLSGRSAVLGAGTIVTTEGLKMQPRRTTLARVDDWGSLGQLVVTLPGLDAVINSWEYWALGRLLGMTPIQAVLDGSVPPWPSGLPQDDKPC